MSEMFSNPDFIRYSNLGGVLDSMAWFDLYVNKMLVYRGIPIQDSRTTYNIYPTAVDKFEFTWIPEYIPAALICSCGNDIFTDIDDHELKERRITCNACQKEISNSDFPEIEKFAL